MSNLGERPVIKTFAEIKQQPAAGVPAIDPEEVWRNLVAIDPAPPGPLASPPYILALPDDWMDDELFLIEAKRLYQERSGFMPLEVVFRPIPRATPANQITFVLPDMGMDERQFAEKAVKIRITLESDYPGNDDDLRWA